MREKAEEGAGLEASGRSPRVFSRMGFRGDEGVGVRLSGGAQPPPRSELLAGKASVSPFDDELVENLKVQAGLGAMTMLPAPSRPGLRGGGSGNRAYCAKRGLTVFLCRRDGAVGCSCSAACRCSSCNGCVEDRRQLGEVSPTPPGQPEAAAAAQDEDDIAASDCSLGCSPPLLDGNTPGMTEQDHSS